MPSENTEQRKLAAIMFTDMVGYSALSQRDGKLALELLEEHRRLLRPRIEEEMLHVPAVAPTLGWIEGEPNVGSDAGECGTNSAWGHGAVFVLNSTPV